MTSNSKKSFFNKYSLYFFVMSLVILFCGIFFTFRIFSKTTHNIKFVINSQNLEDNNININDVMDIEILHDNQDVETLIGMTTNVEDNKKITFRVKLKEGYQTENNNLLTASNIFNNNNNYTDSTLEDNSYYWTTDEITSDRTIEINNIEIIRFEVPEPVIYDYDNNIIDPSLYSLVNWDNYVNYNNKYEFGLDLSQFEENYKIKSTVIQTDLDGELSCEVSNFDDKQYILEIYDHNNEFGGITSKINKFEIFLTPEYIEDSLILASAGGTAETETKDIVYTVGDISFTIEANYATYIDENNSSVKKDSNADEYTVTLKPNDGYTIAKLNTDAKDSNNKQIEPTGSAPKWTLSNIKSGTTTVKLTPTITGTKSFDINGECTAHTVNFTINDNVLKYINTDASSIAFTIDSNEYTVTLKLKDEYKNNGYTIDSISGVSSGSWDNNGTYYGTVTTTGTSVLTPTIKKTAQFDNKTCTVGGVRFQLSKGDLNYDNLDYIESGSVTFIASDTNTYTVSLTPKNSELKIQQLLTSSITIDKANLENTWNITGITAGTDSTPTQVTLTPTMERATVNFTLDDITEKATITLTGELGGDKPTIKVTDGTNTGTANCIVGETYKVKVNLASGHYNITYTGFVLGNEDCMLTVTDSPPEYSITATHITKSITLNWSTIDGSIDIDPIKKITYSSDKVDGSCETTDSGDATIIDTGNGENKKEATFNALKGHDCTINIYLNDGYTQYIRDLSGYNFSSNSTNGIIFYDGDKPYVQIKLGKVNDGTTINLSGFRHDDVEIKFTLPKYNGTPLGQISGPDNSASNGSKTISHKGIINYNEDGTIKIDDTNTDLIFKVKYGATNLEYIYTACDYNNNGVQLDYYKIKLKSNLGSVQLNTDSTDNTIKIPVSVVESGGKPIEGPKEIDLSSVYELALRMVKINFEAGKCCTGYEENKGLDGVTITTDSASGTSETFTKPSGSFNLGEFFVNLSGDVNFSIKRSSTEYTIGIMDATLNNDENKSILKPGHGLDNVFDYTKDTNNGNTVTSTTDLTDKISIPASNLMAVYNGDNTTITITLDNIKKLHKFSFGVSGVTPHDEEDEEAIKGITAYYGGTYTIEGSNFVQNSTQSEVKYNKISGMTESAVFIPDGCSFEYDINLNTDLYKFDNDEFKINGTESNVIANIEKKIKLIQNYKLATLKLSHLDIDDADYNNLAHRIKVYQSGFDKNNKTFDVTKAKTCEQNSNDCSFNMKIRLTNDNDYNKIVIGTLLGAKIIDDQEDTDGIQCVSYTVNNEEKYLTASELTANSEDNSNTRYYCIDFDSSNIDKSSVTEFTLYAELHTCKVNLNCSGMDKLYDSGTDNSLLYDNGWKSEQETKVFYGNSISVRMIFDSSRHNINETGSFLSAVEDYISVVTENGSEYQMIDFKKYTNGLPDSAPEATTSNQSFMLEISQITDANGKPYHEVRVSIFNVIDNITLNCDADSANHQVVKFSEIPGVQYIKLNCEEIEYDGSSSLGSGDDDSADLEEPEYEYSTEGVKFSNMTLTLPVNTEYYFAVFTENPESVNIKDLTMKLNSKDIWTKDKDNVTITKNTIIKKYDEDGSAQLSDDIELIGIVNNINLKTGEESIEIDESDPLQISNDTIGYAFRVKFDEVLKGDNNKKTDAIISGEVPKVKFTVTFEAPDFNYPNDYPAEKRTYINHATYKDYYASTSLSSKEVDYGSSIDFYVELAEHCNKSNFKVVIGTKDASYNNNFKITEELSAVGGRYVYYNITENMTVKIEDLTLNQYMVNFTNNDKVTYYNNSNNQVISGPQTVYYGDDMEFTVKPNTGYTLGDNLVLNKYTVGVGTEELLPDSSSTTDNKIYKLSEIKKDLTINVDKVEDVRYTVSLTPMDGVQYYNDSGLSISGDLKVTYGSSFEFGVSVADAYDESIPGMHIIVNNNTSSKSSAQKLSTGRYMVPNIREDINIKVGNISKNKYIVTLKDVEGADYYDTAGTKIITGDNEVAHGEDLNFKVQLYPAYADSQIKVVRGTQELSPDENNIYTVTNVVENLYVEIGGIDKTIVAKLIETIETLPDTINSEEDIYNIIEATKIYESLTEEQKSAVSNYSILENLQQAIKPFHHEYNNLLVEGLDWHIKLIANPISSDMEVCSRIYDKLSSEYILSLYDVYLWDTIKDERYILPEEQTIIVKLPTPDMNYFEDPSGIHEKEEEKLEFLTLTTSNGYSSMETSSLSPMGIIAKRTNQSGRSSLIDALGEDLQTIADYTLNTLTGKKEDPDENSLSSLLDQDDSQEKVEEYQRENTDTDNIGQTQLGSALKLVLILLIILIIITGVLIFIKNRKDSNQNKNTKK